MNWFNKASIIPIGLQHDVKFLPKLIHKY